MQYFDHTDLLKQRDSREIDHLAGDILRLFDHLTPAAIRLAYRIKAEVKRRGYIDAIPRQDLPAICGRKRLTRWDDTLLKRLCSNRLLLLRRAPLPPARRSDGSYSGRGFRHEYVMHRDISRALDRVSRWRTIEDELMRREGLTRQDARQRRYQLEREAAERKAKQELFDRRMEKLEQQKKRLLARPWWVKMFDSFRRDIL